LATFTGGDLEGDWGTVPQKFEVGDGPFIRPPNILRSSVCGMRARKAWCQQGIIFGNRGFCCEERVIYDITDIKDMENLEKDRRNPKILVDD